MQAPSCCSFLEMMVADCTEYECTDRKALLDVLEERE
jgi:hypothetical protein